MSFPGFDGSLIAVSSGMALGQGEKYLSPNGVFSLRFQTDGNLVLYKAEEPLWASRTNGSGANRCVFQEDGNLCVYKDGHCVFASGTHGRASHGRLLLCLQNDGNLVMYDAHKHPHWSTHTFGGNKAPESAQGKGELAGGGSISQAHASNDAERGIAENTCVVPSSGAQLPRGQKFFSRNRQYYIIFQDDGNLVVYNSANQPLWASGCHGRGGDRCVFQADGNLVIYAGGNPIWASQTYGKGQQPRVFNMQDDGNAVIYDGHGKPIWSTGTEGGKQSAQPNTGRMC